MDEENMKQLVRELLQKNSELIEMLKPIAEGIPEDAVDLEARFSDIVLSGRKDEQGQLQQENAVDIWEHIYDGNEDFPFTMSKGQPLGGTLCLEIKRNIKKNLFFKNLTQIFSSNEDSVVRGKRRRGSKGGFLEAVGLIRTEAAFVQEKNALTPKPLPRNNTAQTEKGTYIMCRIVYSGMRSNKQLKLYFSKEWSKVIKNSPEFLKNNFMHISDLWMLNKKDANLMLPCKALCRFEARELLINVPPWLPLVFTTQQTENLTNIWISYYSETSEKLTRGYLTKKGKTFSHYRCSRKKPWDFYTTVVDEMKGDAKKTIDFMISFTPEAAFQSSNVQ